LLAPEDPSPLSNLSAVLFEKGDYEASLAFIDKTLSLSASEPDDSPKKRRLLSRAVKCHLHTVNLTDAENALVSLEASGSDDVAELRHSLAQMKSLWASAPDPKVLRKQILDRLPRYAPDL
jgi:hypothetical protein